MYLFFPSKNLGAFGDGGAIFTNDATLADKIRMIANHGQSKRYYHDVVGCNSRLDSMQAAILNIKLKHLDAYNRARQTAAEFYSAAFANHPKIKHLLLQQAIIMSSISIHLFWKELIAMDWLNILVNKVYLL